MPEVGRATDLHAEWKGELSTLAFSSSRPILFPVADVIFKTCSVAVHSVSSVCCCGDNDLPLLSVSLATSKSNMHKFYNWRKRSNSQLELFTENSKDIMYKYHSIHFNINS